MDQSFSQRRPCLLFVNSDDLLVATLEDISLELPVISDGGLKYVDEFVCRYAVRRAQEEPWCLAPDAGGILEIARASPSMDSHSTLKLRRPVNHLTTSLCTGNGCFFVLF